MQARNSFHPTVWHSQDFGMREKGAKSKHFQNNLTKHNRYNHNRIDRYDRNQ